MSIRQIKNTIIFLLIIILSNGCLKDDDLNRKFNSYIPVDIQDGLSISNPIDENIDAIALTEIYKDVYTDNELWSLRSLLVFRNGNLVSEAYLKDEKDITERHLIWSCTKQVMGVLTGVAIDNGLISNVNDPISAYFDNELENHQDKSLITIRNLLTMQSGINYNNDGIKGETDKILRQIPDNSIEFIFNLPLSATPGTEFHYNDGNPHILSALIEKVAGKPTDEWADKVLFSKIEMSDYNWVRYKDGTTLGGFGIETTPRELAKIALCVADSGRWKGQQVISTSWIKEMISSHVETKYLSFDFGYYWWIDPIRNIYFMNGHGGQYAFIVPGKKLLIVMTSFPNTQGDYQIRENVALTVVDRIIDASF